MEFQVLGPLQVRFADRFTRIGAAKQRALLGVLLVHTNQVVSVDRLLDEVWGDRQPAGGVKTLRYHISKLRDVLEPDRSWGEEGVIILEAGGHVLRVEPDQVDAGRFEILAGQGAQLLADGEAEMARKHLGEALGLWRGAAFEDFRCDGFAQGEIARLEELRSLSLEDHVQLECQQEGQWKSGGADRSHTRTVRHRRQGLTSPPIRSRLGPLQPHLITRSQMGTSPTHREATDLRFKAARNDLGAIPCGQRRTAVDAGRRESIQFWTSTSPPAKCRFVTRLPEE